MSENSKRPTREQPLSRPTASNRASNIDRKTERQRRYRLGVWGEIMASLSLMLSGHRILARRVRTKVGEIDLIAQRGRRLVMVEVKARRELVDAGDVLTAAQMHRITRASAAWLAQNPRYQSCEVAFDLITVIPWRWPRRFRDVVVPGDQLIAHRRRQ